MILQSSWCFEVHSNSWLSDLKVGEATEILENKEKEQTGILVITELFISVTLYKKDTNHQFILEIQLVHDSGGFNTGCIITSCSSTFTNDQVTMTLW